MKRDMDLIRDILLAFEKSDLNLLSGSDLANLLNRHDGISQHLELMEQAGFTKSHLLKPDPPYPASFHDGYSMTWKGHEFLDSVRDSEIWRKTKDGANAAGGFTVELLADLAKGFIKTQIKKQTGIEI